MAKQVILMERIVTIGTKAGLHARPAARIIKEAGHFQAKIELVRGAKAGNLKSLISLISLGVKHGEVLLLRADGPDAAEAIAALGTLLDRDLDT
jgi:phosphotransferase system HPr (HPr) family protein